MIHQKLRKAEKESMDEVDSSGAPSSKMYFWFGFVTGVALMAIVGLSLMAFGVVGKSSGKNVAVNPTPSVVDDGSGQPQQPFSADIKKDDHVRGDFDAPVTIVEYSDYQCPFCQRFHQTLKQVMEAYGDKVRWVFRHFPLDSIHPNARPASIAAECVSMLKGNDAYWKFSDSLFERQSELGQPLFLELAKKLGVDEKDFTECQGNGEAENVVNAHYQEGLQYGVRGTPGNFINGQSLPGAVPFEQIKSIIDQELSK